MKLSLNMPGAQDPLPAVHSEKSSQEASFKDIHEGLACGHEEGEAIKEFLTGEVAS